jgi:uncharacterized protein (TIGR03118 family)
MFTAGEASATLTVTAPTAFSATALVSDTAGTGALETDTHLVNPWGIAFSPTSPAWVANNHTASSTIYDGNGHAQPAGAPLVVNLPEGAGGVDFDPTGIVFNATHSFAISSNGASATAAFVFDGEGGMIGGWSPGVDADNVVVMYSDAGGAVYKGLAIANNGSGDFLYATDFFNNKVDVFDKDFAKQPAASFPFTDPGLPDGYAPFGIQALPTGTNGATQIYVSYAQQEPPDNDDEADGPGLGIVDVYDTNGALVTQLIAAGGVLDAPWGMALAARRLRHLRQHAARWQLRRRQDQRFRSHQRRARGHARGRGRHALCGRGIVGHCVRQRRQQPAAQHAVLCAQAPTTRRTASTAASIRVRRRRC